MPLRLTFYFLLISVSHVCVYAQSIPESEERFWRKFTFTGQLPAQLVSGRSVLFYAGTFSEKQLEQIQRSYAESGIDAIYAIPLERLLGGHDVRQSLFTSLQKREISNLLFIRRNAEGFHQVITVYNGQPTFTSDKQAAWENTSQSLSELLQQLKREALASFKVQNLLINEQPEMELPLRIFSGSHIEGFTPDLKSDRLAVRLSPYAEENEILKQLCAQYPFKVEFVEFTMSDAELRQKGFWYVLNSVQASQAQGRELLGYAELKSASPSQSSTINQLNNIEKTCKFYLKKLEFEHIYLGKQWDAATTWQQALESFIGNLRRELNIP
jgi:hypothetical protein